MNYSTVIFLLDDEIPIRAMRVSYEENGRKDTIKKTLDQDLKVEDFVLVETGTRYGATVCKIAAADVEVDLESDEEIGWIFAKADMEALENIKAMERSMINTVKEGEKKRKKEALKESLGGAVQENLKAIAAPVIDITPKAEG